MSIQSHTVTYTTSSANATFMSSFLHELEKYFCIYTPSIQQLYVKSHITLPSYKQPQITISVNEENPYDYFVGINASAICQSRYFLIPGELIGKSGLHIAQRKAGNVLSAKTWTLDEFVVLTMKTFDTKEPFLPVLISEDIRQLSKRVAVPAVALHYIRLSALSSAISVFDKQDLQKTINDKLMAKPLRSAVA